MRGRGYGRRQIMEDVDRNTEADDYRKEDGGDNGQRPGEKSEKLSLLTTIAAVATLTLGVIRVIRDAGDLFKKLKKEP
jgi:hypothetical protein